MPKISVIVPVYKVEAYLHRCVDSILAQTFRDFELILVDDGSPDNCGVICDEYAAKDSRIHVIHQENGGLSAARNAGIDWAFANSDSQWLTFIDSDDWIHPEMLRILISSAIRERVCVSTCGFCCTRGKTPDIKPDEDRTCCKTIEEYYTTPGVNPAIACSKLYKKECFNIIRYPVGKLHEDEFTTYRILFSEQKIAVIEDPLYYYFCNEQGITYSSWTPGRLDALEALQEQISYFERNGFYCAYKHIVLTLRSVILDQIKQIENSALLEGKEKETYTEYLKEYAERVYIQYKDIYDQADANVNTICVMLKNIYYRMKTHIKEKLEGIKW